jgi:protein SCO1/2
MHRRTIRHFGFAAALAAGTMACRGDGGVARDAFVGVSLADPPTMPAISLPDQHGRPFPLADSTRGYVTLLFVGYTNCPDVCPVHLANLAAVIRDLSPSQARRLRTVFVTADPERDTAERLREWLGALHPEFVGLRGTREEINALEAALGLPASVVEPGATPGEYFVGHASQILAFDENGRARASYPWGVRQRDWKRDLPRLLAGDWPDPDSTTEED